MHNHSMTSDTVTESQKKQDGRVREFCTTLLWLHFYWWPHCYKSESRPFPSPRICSPTQHMLLTRSDYRYLLRTWEKPLASQSLILIYLTSREDESSRFGCMKLKEQQMSVSDLMSTNNWTSCYLVHWNFECVGLFTVGHSSYHHPKTLCRTDTINNRKEFH